MTGRNELAANIIDGVYVCDNPDEEVLFDDDFYNAIMTAGYITIYGNVSDEIAQKIENEFGIH